MPRFEASRLIRRPPSEVFALVGDGVRVGSIGTEPEGQLLRREIEVEHVDGPQGWPDFDPDLRRRRGGARARSWSPIRPGEPGGKLGPGQIWSSNPPILITWSLRWLSST